MSAFVTLFERSGEAADRAELERLAAPLAHYGGELSLFCHGPVGIAVRHGAGSDARQRHGPLEGGGGRVAAVVGRFVPVASRRSADGVPGSDRLRPAVRIARTLSRAGPAGDGEPGAPMLWDALLAGLSGPFVLVAADPAAGSLEIARDPLGSLKVYYAIDGDRLIAASEAAAILRHPSVSADPDEGSIARFLGFRFGFTERSFFRSVRELPPAHRMRVTAGDARVARYWRFGQPPAVSEDRLEEAAPRFRRGLERAVADDLAGLEPRRVGLSLSGGLDSTAIAAVAPRGVRAFSWTFDETPEGDERERVAAVSRHLGLPVRQVAGDGLHPLCDGFVERFVEESSPYLNPFSALKDRLYSVAREEGCERVLVGDGGDALYGGGEFWLRDALATARPWALAGLAGAAARSLRGDRSARRALRRVLPLPAVRRSLGASPAPWLTPDGHALLPAERPSPILPRDARGDRYEVVVGTRNVEIESEERRLFARCGVGRSNPFWSWPLLELTTQLPAYLHQRGGRTKLLTREAFRDLLPASVIEGERTGVLGALFLRGLGLRRESLLEDVFRRPRSDWPRYVRRDWLERYLPDGRATARPLAFGHTILWRVISYELWVRRLSAAGGGGE